MYDPKTDLIFLDIPRAINIAKKLDIDPLTMYEYVLGHELNHRRWLPSTALLDVLELNRTLTGLVGNYKKHDRDEVSQLKREVLLRAIALTTLLHEVRPMLEGHAAWLLLVAPETLSPALNFKGEGEDRLRRYLFENLTADPSAAEVCDALMTLYRLYKRGYFVSLLFADSLSYFEPMVDSPELVVNGSMENSPIFRFWAFVDAALDMSQAKPSSISSFLERVNDVTRNQLLLSTEIVDQRTEEDEQNLKKQYELGWEKFFTDYRIGMIRRTGLESLWSVDARLRQDQELARILLKVRLDRVESRGISLGIPQSACINTAIDEDGILHLNMPEKFLNEREIQILTVYLNATSIAHQMLRGKTPNCLLCKHSICSSSGKCPFDGIVQSAREALDDFRTVTTELDPVWEKLCSAQRDHAS
jgi:hypothetical protein